MYLPDQFNGLVGRHGDDAPRGRELEEEADHTEEVDVGVVHGKVHLLFIWIKLPINKR